MSGSLRNPRLNAKIATENINIPKSKAPASVGKTGSCLLVSRDVASMVKFPSIDQIGCVEERIESGKPLRRRFELFDWSRTLIHHCDVILVSTMPRRRPIELR